MTPKPSDEELDERLLEIALERELGEPRPDLSPLVRKALEVDRVGDEGEDMNAIAIGLNDDRRGESGPARLWRNLDKKLLVNAAAVLLVAAIGVLALKSGDLFRGDDGHGRAAVPPVDAQQSETEQLPELPVVTNLAEVKALEPGLTAVACSGEDFDDAAMLELCASQPDLARLRIIYSTVTEKGLRGLPGLRKLEHLELPSNSYFSEAGWLIAVQLRQLVTLDVSSFVGQTASFGDEERRKYPERGVPANARVLREIMKLPRLRSLDLLGVDCSDALFIELAARLGPQLEVLDISITPVGAEGLAHLGDFVRLRELALVGLGRRAESALAVIPDMPALRRLRIGSGGMTPAEMKDDTLLPLARLTKLSHLSIDYSSFSAGSLEPLRELKELRSLELNRSPKLEAAHIAVIGSLDRLESLSLRGCGSLTSEQLESLRSCSASRVDLAYATRNLSEADIAAFARALPGRSITCDRKPPFGAELEPLVVEVGEHLTRLQSPTR